MREKEKLLAEIMEINNIVGQITNQLKKDPSDRNMVALFKDYLAKRRTLLKRYEPVYGVLTMDCKVKKACEETEKKSLSLGRIYFIWRG